MNKYSKEFLTAFGEYLLSDERKEFHKNLEQNQGEVNDELIKITYEMDIEYFTEKWQQKQPNPISFGMKAVGLNFHPINPTDVHKLQQACAEIIDFCNERIEPTNDGQKARMLNEAITNIQQASSWAERAITWQE